MIIFQKQPHDEKDPVHVALSVAPHATWMEVADAFVDFLKGAGYSVTAKEIAEYLEER